MWEDATYQWRAAEKHAAIFDLFAELTKVGQVIAHAEQEADWLRWFAVAKLALKWARVAKRRMRRSVPLMLGLLTREYHSYYEGAPHDQDSADPNGFMRDEDHRKEMQKFRKARYKLSESLKDQYQATLQPLVAGKPTGESVVDDAGWVLRVVSVPWD